jgi:hypothetical protein
MVSSQSPFEPRCVAGAASIAVCPALASLVRGLAELSRCTPDLEAVRRAADAAASAFDELERALGGEGPLPAREIRCAYLTATLLVRVLAEVAATDVAGRDRSVPFLRTALKMVKTIDRAAEPAERAIVVRVLASTRLPETPARFVA